MARTIQSPGVEIKEYDLSENTSPAIGTYIFTTGFADKGPTDEVLQVTSAEEFEQIYGAPTTPAERYFYHSVTQQFNSQANVLVARLPYGNENGEGFNTDNKYSVLAYPVTALSAVVTSSSDIEVVSSNFNDGNEFIIQKPVHFELSEEKYLKLQEGQLIKWSNESKDATDLTLETLGNAGLIIVNKAQTTINDKYEGYYVGISDNIACEPNSKYQSILSVQSVNTSANITSEYIEMPSARMNFALSADAGSAGNSISQIMEDSSQFSIFGSEFDDTLTFNIFKLRKSLYADSTIKLDAILSESYVASVDSHRQMQSQNGGAPVSFFVEKKAENSTDVQILVNPFLSGKKNGKTWLGDNGKPTKKIRVAFSDKNTEFNAETFDTQYAKLYGLTFAQASAFGVNTAADALFPVGTYQASNPSTKVLGSIPDKLSRILAKLENRDLFELDITCEAGLGTIWAYSKANSANNYEFDDEFDAYSLAEKGKWFVTGQDSFDGTGDSDILVNYRTIYNIFANFASNDRKDHMFIADPLRFIFLQGANSKTLSNKTRTFSQNIYWPLRYQFMTANTSYAATYGNWAKVYDAASDGNVWIPMSGILATTYANTDTNYYCWYAPAGPDRGILTTINDIALSPTQKQRDQLYKISINPIYQDPNMGFVVFGQKTLQSKPSSFDRINVRRLFLYLEKSTYNTIKWFLFRNNTYSTRLAIINTLDPIFKSCKNNEGVYDYRIICSEQNNTQDVIDANELKVSIYLQAVRTAEFILVDFYSTKTGTNFDELIK